MKHSGNSPFLFFFINFSRRQVSFHQIFFKIPITLRNVCGLYISLCCYRAANKLQVLISEDMRKFNPVLFSHHGILRLCNINNAMNYHVLYKVAGSNCFKRKATGVSENTLGAKFGSIKTLTHKSTPLIRGSYKCFKDSNG